MITVYSILGTQIQANTYEAGNLKLTSLTPEKAKANLTNSECAEVPVALPPGVLKHLSLADAPEDLLIEIGLLKGEPNHWRGRLHVDQAGKETVTKEILRGSREETLIVPMTGKNIRAAM